MTPKGERVWTRSLWTAALAIELAAVGLILQVLLMRRSPVLVPDAPSPSMADPASSPTSRARDIESLGKKQMTKAIVRAVAPPPAPPAKPPLGSLVRLSGIMDYGKAAPREALIELVPKNETKGYKVGETIAGADVRVTGIGDAVTLEYDGRKWTLTFEGANEHSGDPAGNGGSEPKSRED